LPLTQGVTEDVRLFGLLGRKQELFSPLLSALADRATYSEARLPVGQHSDHHPLQPGAVMKPVEQRLQNQPNIATTRRHQPQILQGLLHLQQIRLQQTGLALRLLQLNLLRIGAGNQSTQPIGAERRGNLHRLVGAGQDQSQRILFGHAGKGGVLADKSAHT